jgi:hypothetical protein
MPVIKSDKLIRNSGKLICHDDILAQVCGSEIHFYDAENFQYFGSLYPDPYTAAIFDFAGNTYTALIGRADGIHFYTEGAPPVIIPCSGVSDAKSCPGNASTVAYSTADGLYVFNGSTSTKIETTTSAYNQICWTPDGNSLVCFKQTVGDCNGYIKKINKDGSGAVTTNYYVDICDFPFIHFYLYYNKLMYYNGFGAPPPLSVEHL